MTFIPHSVNLIRNKEISMKRTIMLLAILFLIGCNNSNSIPNNPYTGVYKLSSSNCSITFTEIYLNSEFRLTTNDHRSGTYSDLEEMIKFDDGLIMKAILGRNNTMSLYSQNTSCEASFIKN